VISDVVQDYKHQIEKADEHDNNLELVYESNKGSTITLEADKNKVSQVISNLLSNAIKFTKEGTISITLEKKEGDDSQVIIGVKDTGTGIDPEIFPKLFTMFASTSNEDTGLGLFICKSIIEAHSGKIWAENNKDGQKGATFYFSLPISK
jgi:signal transduction histidine kinase